MIRRTLSTIGVFAAGTFAVTLATLAPVPMQAGDEPSGLRPVIEVPKLNVSGIELSLKSQGQSSEGAALILKPGADWKLELVATNTSDRAVQIDAGVCVYASAKVSPLSRTPPAMKQTWKKEMPLALGPNESRTISLSPDTKIEDGMRFSVSIESGEKHVDALYLWAKSS